MKNWEAYEKEIKKLGIYFAVKKYKGVVNCSDTKCIDCEFYKRCTSKSRAKWLYEEYNKRKETVKIPIAIKIFLENLDKQWQWIAKDETGRVYVYDIKPFKKGSVWDNNDGVDCDFANVGKLLDKKLLDFISWNDEEPTNIKELLENCEVIEDERKRKIQKRF